MYKKQKNFYSLLLVIAILLTMILPATAAQVSDIQGHWAKDQISRWMDMGLVNGYKDGSFKPNGYITRAEFMTVANKAFGFTKTASESYPDVKKSDWFYSEALKAKAAGYMDVYADGSVKAKNYITREETAVALARILKLKPADSSKANFKDVGSINSGNRGYINAVVEKGYIAGYKDNTFKPFNKTTRAEAVTLLSKVVGQLYNKAGNYGPSKGTTTIEGNVTINKAGVKLSNTIIKGNLYLTEGIGDGEATLDNVTVKGTTTISGGGEHSIVALNSALGGVYIKVPDNTKVRLVAQGITSIKSVVAESATKLEESNLTGTGFNEVTISVPENTSVDLAGNFEKVDITAENAKVSLLSGTAKEVTIQESNIASQLEIGENAAVTTLVANDEVSVTGKGKIDTAQINASNVSIEQKPATVKVTEGVTGTTVANLPATSQPAPSQPTTGGNPGGGGSGGGGGNSGGNGGNQTQTVAAPTASPAEGPVGSGTSVTLNTSTGGARIYYTLDGTTPTTASTLYTAPVVLTNTGTAAVEKTIKAIAVKSGMNNSAVTSITYTITPVQKAAIPTASPASGAVSPGTIVILSTATEGAKIYYTTDGSIPTAASTLYTASIAITKATTIKAVAVKTGLNDSEVAIFNYTIISADRVAVPTASPASGAVSPGTSVILSTATDGAKIYYTTDGSIPTAASTLYTAPIAITKATTIKAVAAKTGLNDSEVATFNYTILPSDKVATPTASPAAGEVPADTRVTLSSATEGAKIYYTADGSIPTAASTLYTASIAITKATTIKAVAVKTGLNDSEVATFNYTILPADKVATPTASPNGGTFTSGKFVTLATATSGARIYYTLDGTTPTTASKSYGGTITLTNTGTVPVEITLMAIAVKDGFFTDSEVATFKYTILPVNIVATPKASSFDSPAASGTRVTLSTSTEGATIYYTLDGSLPTTASTVYKEPIVLENPSTSLISKTIRAKAVKTGMEDSNILLIICQVAPGEAAAPVASPVSGEIAAGTGVVLRSTTEGGKIYYTTDGSIPTNASTLYTAPIVISQATTINAITIKDGIKSSVVETFNYIILTSNKVAAPTASPAAGSVASGTPVTLSTSTEGATIYYTVDGSIPNTFSAVYSDPIMLTNLTSGIEVKTIKAVAVKEAMESSSVAVYEYSVLPQDSVQAPTASPTSGDLAPNSIVTLSSATSGAKIYYTTDGSNPTTASTLYTAYIAINQAMTIKAIAVKENMFGSAVSVFSYTVSGSPKVAAPRASPDPGLKPLTEHIITLSTSTEGASIYYTTNGSTPVASNTMSSQLYTKPLNISTAATTIKAIAVLSGMTNSDVAIFDYSYKIDTPAASVADGSGVDVGTAITLKTTPSSATIRYTTDGSIPTKYSKLYTSSGIIIPDETTTIKAFAYSSKMLDSEVLTVTYTINPPKLPATENEIKFPDQDYDPGEYGGYIYWLSASDEKAIAGYKLYFVDSSGKKIGNPFATVKKGSFGNRYYLPLNTVLPSGAVNIGIYSYNSGGECTSGPLYAIVDNIASTAVYAPSQLVQCGSFIDSDDSEGHLGGTLRWDGYYNETLIQGYKIYFTDFGFSKVSLIGTVGPGYHSFSLGGTQIPRDKDAKLIHVCAYNQHGESPGEYTGFTDVSTGAPTLYENTKDNKVGESTYIYFIDKADWRSKITGVYVTRILENGELEDYERKLELNEYSVSAGMLIIKTSWYSYLWNPGEYRIRVKATNYNDTSTHQHLTMGQAHQASCTIAGTPLIKGGKTEYTLTAKNQSDIKLPGYQFKLDISFINNNPATDERYEIDDKTDLGGQDIQDMELSNVTKGNSKETLAAKLNVKLPETIDPGDGVVVRVMLNDGITQAGDAIVYIDSVQAPVCEKIEYLNDGSKIFVKFNKAMDPSSNFKQITVLVDGSMYIMSTGTLNADDPSIVELIPAVPIPNGTTVSAFYRQGGIKSADGGYLEYFSMNATQLAPLTAPEVLGVETNEDGKIIFVTFNKNMVNPDGNKDRFTVNVTTGGAITVSSVSLKSGNPEVIELNLDGAVAYGAGITLSYDQGNVASTEGVLLENFSDRMVDNKVLASEEALKLVGVETSEDGMKILVRFNKEMSDPSGNIDKFTVTTGAAITISSIKLNNDDPTVIELELKVAVAYGDEIKISYEPGDIKTSDGKELLERFVNKTVINKVLN